MAQARIRVRTDEELKERFDYLCDYVGISSNDVLNAFMWQSVRDNQLHLNLRGDPSHEEF